MKVEDFYSADPARRMSGEADYGVMWTIAPLTWPTWRVSYVRDTGEVYACCLGGTTEQRGDVLILGTLAPAEGERRLVEAAEGNHWTQPLDDLLAGWAEQHDLAWVAYKLAGTYSAGGVRRISGKSGLPAGQHG